MTLCLLMGADEPPESAWIDGQMPSLLTFYRDLHANPELSYQEVETSKKVAESLRKSGAEVTTGVGKLGVVGILKNGDGPTVLVRSDLDALPVAEETGLPFASKATAVDDSGKTVPVMHACGHDIHMTCLVGVARWLAEHKDRWRGTVMLIGQPAEERIGGARAMLKDGLYEKFGKPDFALALHVAHDLETGKVDYCSGPAMAGVASMDLTVKGHGGHGAMPHNTVDPIVLASTLIVDMQSIVSREIKPIDPAVITVGSIHGGTKHNIIPNDVHLQLTLRAFRPEVLDQLVEGIERRARALAVAHKAPAPEISVGDSTPPTINTPSLVSKVVPSLENALGAANVVTTEPTMGAEDFGLFGQGGVPTFMFRLGTIPTERLARAEADPLPSLHSALYFPDAEPSIRTGIRAMSAAVVGLLPAGK
jgi:hippurate hydrolase